MKHKMIKLLVKAVKQGKFDNEEAFKRLEKMKDSLLDYESEKRYLNASLQTSI